WRICWLGCSVFWNLARTNQARNIISINNGIKLILNIIDNHIDISLVIQTALGALSNLCINNNIKKEIGNTHIINKLIYNIIEIHIYDNKVLTSTLGLLTNLACDENISYLMIPNCIKYV